MTRVQRLYLMIPLLLAVMLRGIIPAGFMPDFGAHGAHLTICTGEGAQYMDLPARYDPLASGKIPAAHHAAPCDFYLTTIGLLPIFVALSSLPVPMAMAVSPFLLAASSVYRRRRYLLAVAQAPPVLFCS